MMRPTLAALAWASLTLFVSAKERRLCRQFQNQTSEDGMYNLGTNQWGADGSGGQCVTYDPEAEPEPGATAFTATWKWVEAVNSVHAYPNVYYESREFPMHINNTNTFNVDINWTYGMGNEPAETTDTDELMENGVKANVAFDFFLDMNQTSSSNASLAEYEFMVWLGAFGGAQPLGWDDPTNPKMTYNIDNQDFALYTGQNDRGQNVYSWFPAAATTLNAHVESFTGDLGLLLKEVVNAGLLDPSIYLGSVQFGSEATHSPMNVTFNANPVMMDLEVFERKSESELNSGLRTAASSALLLVSTILAAFWTL